VIPLISTSAESWLDVKVKGRTPMKFYLLNKANGKSVDISPIAARHMVLVKIGGRLKIKITALLAGSSKEQPIPVNNDGSLVIYRVSE
jgi:hypothetical protein